MARTYSAEGIVLRRTNFGEADRLITFLTRYKGKLTALAKGVRRIASRRAPHLELLNHVKIFLAVGKNFDIVTEAEAIATFKQTKENLNKVGFGFYLVEVTNEFLAEGQGARVVFELLLRALRLLETETNLEKIKTFLRAYELKFLEAVGFRPQLEVCVKCGHNVGRSNVFLSPEAGGIIDGSCAASSLFVKKISPDAAKTLRFLQREDWQNVERLSVYPRLNAELERSLRFYLEYLLEKEIKSAKFLEEIRKG